MLTQREFEENSCRKRDRRKDVKRGEGEETGSGKKEDMAKGRNRKDREIG